MALGTTRLEFLLTGNASGLLRELDKVGAKADKEFGKARSAADRWQTGLTRGGAAAVGFAAVVGTGLFKAAKASEDAQKSLLKLENTIANMPKLAGENADAFVDLATAIQKKTAADADQIIEAEAMLGTFQLTGDEIRKVTPLVVDYARKFGVDLVGASIQVGKALDGQIGALRRNGVSIDEVAYKADKFGAVTEALRQQVGGFAEAEGKTFAGQMESLKNQLGDVVEGIGSGVVPVLEDLLGPLKAAAAGFADLDPAVQKSIGTFATWGTVAVGAVGSLSFAAGQFAKMRDRFTKVDATTGVRSLNGFGKAATVAGVAAVGLGTALTVLQAHAGKTDRAVSDLKDTVQATGRSLGVVAAEQLAEFIGEADSGPEILNAVGVSVTDLSAALQGSEGQWRSVRDRLTDFYEAQNDAAGGMSTLQILALELANTLDEKRDAFTKAKDEIKTQNAATDELRGTTLDATKAVDGLGDATGDLGDDTKTTVERMRDLADAQQKVRDEFERTIDAVYGTRDAQRALEEANWDAKDAVEAHMKSMSDGESTIYDIARAENDAEAAIDAVGQAAIDAAIDQGKLSEKQRGTKAAVAVQIAALRDFEKTVDPNSPLHRYINGLIADLDRLFTPRVVNNVIMVNGKPVTVTSLTEHAGLHVGGAAEGGPVKGREPVLVGEEGPEIYVPKGAAGKAKTARLDRNKPAVIGTRGPEIIVPPADGIIVPNDEIEGWRATGGPVRQDKPYVVGEKGRELYIPKVANAAKTARKEVGELAAAQAKLGARAVPNLVQASMYMAYELDHLLDKPITPAQVKRVSDVAKVFTALAQAAKDSPAIRAVQTVVRLIQGSSRSVPREAFRPVRSKPGPERHGMSAFIEAGPAGRGDPTSRLFARWTPSRERDAAGRDPRVPAGMPRELAARLTGQPAPRVTPAKGSVDKRFERDLARKSRVAAVSTVPTAAKGSTDGRFERDLARRAGTLSGDLARTVGRAIPRTALAAAVKTGGTSAAPMTINITMPPGSDGYDVVQALEKYRRRNGSFPWTGAA